MERVGIGVNFFWVWWCSRVDLLLLFLRLLVLVLFWLVGLIWLEAV